MSELLLELFSEEIPALMQKNAAIAYKEIFTNILQENGIIAEIAVFIGPRRVAIYINNLPSFIPAKKTSIKGPKVSAPEQAITGFCRVNNIDKSELTTSLVQGQLYYIIEKETARTDIHALLLNIIPKAISNYVWPKSMYWGEYEICWIRPLKNILCIFDGEVLEVKYGHLTANNISFGHRFISPEAIIIKSFAQYCAQLAENQVIIDQIRRQEIIKTQLSLIAGSLNLVIKEDPKLLEEVTGLVEFPVVMIGKIPEKFLLLPSEVLISSMRLHQKYFASFDQRGNLAPYFFFVSNMPADDNIIVAGNEKVLAARLSDALYFYQQDLLHNLSARLVKLSQITFHAKLGSLKEKTTRMAKICDYLMPENQNLHLAARICKSDLTSEMVGEFPDLQGIMGYYYAKAEGLNEEIAVAIRDHYKPQGPADNLPLGDSAIIALADKLDSLVGLLLVGEEPTGSRDPYSLRRQALGIIRIIMVNKLAINISQLVAFTTSLYSDITEKNILEKKQDIILAFLTERVKYHFKNQYEMSLINAVLDLANQGNLVDSEMKLSALQQFLADKDGEKLLIIYKRANNILATSIIEGEVNQQDFISPYEQSLFSAIADITKQIDNYIAEKSYIKALSTLIEILQPINNFFEHVMVNDTDPKIANNRQLLLKMVVQLFDKLAKFNYL
jgi:glycyl-tRNA synthetase beta chain